VIAIAVWEDIAKANGLDARSAVQVGTGFRLRAPVAGRLWVGLVAMDQAGEIGVSHFLIPDLRTGGCASEPGR
jgi:hypothetical protein